MIALPQGDSYSETLHDLVPDLTPMLDILFILLVFFMLTAGAIFQSLELQLPTSASETLPLARQQPITLEIRENDYALNGQIIPDFPALQHALPSLLARHSQQDLIVAGDRRVSIERLLQVLTYLQAQGVETANILLRSAQD